MEYKEKVTALLNSQELSKEQKEKLEEIFPELREQEDERIKSAAIEFVIQNKSFNYYLGISKDDVVTWINRQGKQKPAVWSEKDERMFGSVVWHLRYSVNNGDVEYSAGQLEDWFESLKERIQSQSHWKPSERQKEALLWCIDLDGTDKQTLGDLLEELNKL